MNTPHQGMGTLKSTDITPTGWLTGPSRPFYGGHQWHYPSHPSDPRITGLTGQCCTLLVSCLRSEFRVPLGAYTCAAAATAPFGKQWPDTLAAPPACHPRLHNSTGVATGVTESHNVKIQKNQPKFVSTLSKGGAVSTVAIDDCCIVEAEEPRFCGFQYCPRFW
eukprot:CAMPEP_0174369344 /NCGR_PEP_ID=MMETSP0811_2-20130205/92146_1 /TAXON_ID=73025 ORGANISM="Eutreptiella gymnastica-like, Strain CCMP1594" /NCGR_SAMPLE_ID=MMETSP0811_2 /ASSEMBLY_ACC=CAM_ASM_000667 /LENGTH=163 /DNA_ID=CAMNT_0015513689 /DNA_START=30 /DNA_END=518 /DNA_ORIENTATION=-